MKIIWINSYKVNLVKGYDAKFDQYKVGAEIKACSDD